MDATARFLNKLVREESRSFLQYVSESFPWTPNPESSALDRIQAMAHAEREQVAQLIRWMLKSRVGNPAPGTYPEPFTSTNFLALDNLIPKLIDDQKKGIATLETGMVVLLDPQLIHAVNKLIQLKRDHLQQLTHLSAGPSQSNGVPVPESLAIAH